MPKNTANAAISAKNEIHGISKPDFYEYIVIFNTIRWTNIVKIYGNTFFNSLIFNVIVINKVCKIKSVSLKIKEI